MNSFLRRLFVRLLPVVFLACAFAAAGAAPVLMISIDGLKPEYVTQADAHGLKVPYLRSLLHDGTYADGVVGVFPTVTYPSHTTLVTGVRPAQHGIYNNLEFDPYFTYGGAWFWYSQQIKAPTLWHAAHAAGMHTASVGWPVTVGNTDIDYLIPEYWRSLSVSSAQADPSDRLLMSALSRPEALFSEVEPAAGPYMTGNDTDTAGDESKTRYSIEILRRFKPSFMTIHLSSLDEAEHEHAPFSAEADQTLEAIDGMVSRLASAALAADPSTDIVVVSDHGFLKIEHYVNLAVPFVKAGLVDASLDPQTHALHVASWKVEPWMAGGMAAIMLHDPADHETEQKVKAILDKLAADPANGIAKVLDRAGIEKTGGFPNAAFLVILKPGYYTGGGISGDLVTPVEGSRGSHGFSPEYPEMHSSFFAAGAGIAQNRDLGVIDMRQIAPTVAAILGVDLPTATSKPLDVKP